MHERIRFAATIIMVVLVVFLPVLASCSAGDSYEQAVTPESPSVPVTPEPTETLEVPNMPEASDTAPPVTRPHGDVGMYDPGFDYSSQRRYKVAYVVGNNTSGLYSAYDDAFADWAELLNIEYHGIIDFSGDGDTLFNELPQLASEYDGLIVDAYYSTMILSMNDSERMLRVKEIMDAAGTPWMSLSGVPRDYSIDDAPLIHPWVGKDHYGTGAQFPAKLLEYKDKLWPDVPIEEFGFITIDFSVIPEIHAHSEGAYDALTILEPDMAADRYFTIDVATGFMDPVSNTLFFLEANPHIEYWLVSTAFSSFASDAAKAFSEFGLTDTVCIASESLENDLWDDGITYRREGLVQLPVPGEWYDSTKRYSLDEWRIALLTPVAILTEPVIGALYAFMSGWATPETIWPQWVNANDCGGDGKTYASRLVPFYWVDRDSYKEVLKWTDIYAGTNQYPDYPLGNLTRASYTTKTEPPDHYVLE